MRIIKRVEPKKLGGKHTCGDCHSVFEWEQSDIQSDQRDGNYIICPVCKAFIATRVLMPPGWDAGDER